MCGAGAGVGGGWPGQAPGFTVPGRHAVVAALVLFVSVPLNLSCGTVGSQEVDSQMQPLAVQRYIEAGRASKTGQASSHSRSRQETLLRGSTRDWHRARSTLPARRQARRCGSREPDPGRPSAHTALLGAAVDQRSGSGWLRRPGAAAAGASCGARPRDSVLRASGAVRGIRPPTRYMYTARIPTCRPAGSFGISHEITQIALSPWTVGSLQSSVI